MQGVLGASAHVQSCLLSPSQEGLLNTHSSALWCPGHCLASPLDPSPLVTAALLVVSYSRHSPEPGLSTIVWWVASWRLCLNEVQPNPYSDPPLHILQDCPSAVGRGSGPWEGEVSG